MTTLDAPFRPLPVRYWLVERLWRACRAIQGAKARPAEQDTPVRILFVLIVFGFAFTVLAAGAAAKALLPHGRSDYVSGAVARADLVDRNGAILAMDLTHYALYVDPREVWDTAETRDKLARVLPGVSANRIDRVLKGERRAYLVGALTPEQKQRIHDLGLPGIVFEAEDRRVYPMGASAAHLIGFTDKGGEGLSGAELALDDLIRDQGRTGQPVPLSIDVRIQAALEDELQTAVEKHMALGGVGIVTNVQTGEVLGLASAPDFDPAQAGRTGTDPLTNRAAASVWEMGSIFKVFSVAMGLDSGTASLDTTFDARTPLSLGSRAIRDFHAENRVMTLSDIFLHSSNIGVARLGLQAGSATLQRYYKGFGLFEPAEIELAESAKPILPRAWDDNAVSSATFGHAMSVSPLAVAAGMGAVLNGGRYVPLTVRKMERAERPKGKRVLKSETSRIMLDLMRMNVTTGTGGKADAPGLRVGGKTGSAEKAGRGGYQRNKLVSSFAAVFPTDGPLEADRYFVLILLDEPKGIPETFGFATGGWTATPPAGRVIDRIAAYLGVKRAPPTLQQQAKMAAAAKIVAPPPPPAETVSGVGE